MWTENSFILEMDIKDLEEKILSYAEELGGLEGEILKQRYLEGRKEINLRLLAKEFKVSSKKVELAIENAENKLYRHLQQWL